MDTKLDIQRNRNGSKTITFTMTVSQEEMGWAQQCSDPVVRSTDDLQEIHQKYGADQLLAFLRIYTHYCWLNDKRTPDVTDMVTRQARRLKAETTETEKQKQRRERRARRKAARRLAQE